MERSYGFPSNLTSKQIIFTELENYIIIILRDSPRRTWAGADLSFKAKTFTKFIAKYYPIVLNVLRLNKIYSEKSKQGLGHGGLASCGGPSILCHNFKAKSHQIHGKILH